MQGKIRLSHIRHENVTQLLEKDELSSNRVEFHSALFEHLLIDDYYPLSILSRMREK